MVGFEKWDPLTKLKQQTCSTFGEDRAKLIKSKKLKPVSASEKCEPTVLERSKCSTFFFDKKHLDDHEENCVTAKLESIYQSLYDREIPSFTNNTIFPKITQNEFEVDENTPKFSPINDDSEVSSKKLQKKLLEIENEPNLMQGSFNSQLEKLTKKQDVVESEGIVMMEDDQGTVIVPKIIERNGTPSSTKKINRSNLQNNDDDNNNNRKRYTCAYCLRNFRRKSNLKRHMSKLHDVQRKHEVNDPDSWFTGYCCDICGEGLQVRSTMLAHRDVMHAEYAEMEWCKYQTSLARVKFCCECKKYFRSGKLADEHACDRGAGITNQERMEQLKKVEEKAPPYFCDICRLCFRWKWDYRLHRDAEHKEASSVNWDSIAPRTLQYVCDKCFKVSANEAELNQHACSAISAYKKRDISIKPFRCDICGNEYCWKSDFRRHMRTKHPKEHRPTEHDTIVYTCPYCEEKFSIKKRILHHMRKEHNINSDSPFVCVKCNKVFQRRDNLDRHNESYHPTVKDEEADEILKHAGIRINGELMYHCRVCNRNFTIGNRFISHYRAHYSENKFTCDSCGKQVKTQHQLNKHIKNVHLNIRNYKCDFCDKSFYTKQACEEHRRIHTGERPFSCEICGKTFIAGNALISHKRFHNDFYPHSCHLCPKKFKVRRSLINHIRTHTGERPFECNLCTKTFNNSSQYSYHIKVTHSEARPFVCLLCGNRFKANKFLSRHMEKHTQREEGGSHKTGKAEVAADRDLMKTSSIESMTAISAIIAEPSTEISSPTISIVPAYDVKPTITAFQNDNVTVSLYNVERNYKLENGFTSRGEADTNSSNCSFTGPQAYITAAHFALAPTIEEYKDPSIMQTYDVNSAPGNTALVDDKQNELVMILN